jgi:hypothetical protein
MSSARLLWRVWVSEAAREALIAAADAADPDEIGGVLVGVMLDRGHGAGRPWVTHAVVVASRKRGRSHYELPADARRRVVTRLRKTDSRLGYLGDWHSHPTDVGPSPTDIESIESASVEGDCPRPLLFLVRRGRKRYRIDPRQWTGKSLRRLQLRASGPLPRQDPKVGRRHSKRHDQPRRKTAAKASR